MGSCMATQVKVLSDGKSGDRTGDWLVRKGRTKVSRHRKKSAAVKKAKQTARGTAGKAVLRVQDTNGNFGGIRAVYD